MLLIDLLRCQMEAKTSLFVMTDRTSLIFGLSGIQPFAMNGAHVGGGS